MHVFSWLLCTPWVLSTWYVSCCLVCVLCMDRLHVLCMHVRCACYQVDGERFIWLTSSLYVWPLAWCLHIHVVHCVCCHDCACTFDLDHVLNLCVAICIPLVLLGKQVSHVMLFEKGNRTLFSLVRVPFVFLLDETGAAGISKQIHSFYGGCCPNLSWNKVLSFDWIAGSFWIRTGTGMGADDMSLTNSHLGILRTSGVVTLSSTHTIGLVCTFRLVSEYIKYGLELVTYWIVWHWRTSMRCVSWLRHLWD